LSLFVCFFFVEAEFVDEAPLTADDVDEASLLVVLEVTNLDARIPPEDILSLPSLSRLVVVVC